MADDDESDELVLVRRLAGQTAHELNNPLQVILSFGQLIQRGEVQPEKLASHLASLREAAQRCRELVGALRDVALPAGRTEALDVRAQTTNAVSRLAMELAGVKVEVVPGAARPPLTGPADVLRRLVSSSVRALAESGGATPRVEVAVEELAEGGARLVIVDPARPGPSPLHDVLLEPREDVRVPLRLVAAALLARDLGGRLLAAADPQVRRLEIALPGSRHA